MVNNLAGNFDKDSLMYFREKEFAYKELKRISGQDFGYDVEA
ncbi:MAG: hypothetical protein AAFR81_24305 [Chloroflexota bacterium]